MEGGQHLEPGARLGEYRIESVLGQGGFGVTYAAHDTHLDKRVAIKEYLPRDWAIRVNEQTVGPRSDDDRDDYQWGLERFVDEARALARFDHPNLNRVHRFFEAHGTAYLVLEYIDGDPLSKVLARQGALSAPVVGWLMKELCSALAEVHRAGYIHRDIKPGNILLRRDGTAVLVDFGAARQAVGGRSRSITTVLTPGYAPIEQYDSKGTDIGPWTDLYALGMVAYRCVTGCGEGDLVEANTRARQVFRGQADELVPAVQAAGRGYPRALLEAIDWAIAVNEDDRPQAAEALQAALEGTTPSRPDRGPRTTGASGNDVAPGSTTDAPDASARGEAAGGREEAVGPRPASARTGESRWLIPTVMVLLALFVAAGAGLQYMAWSGGGGNGQAAPAADDGTGTASAAPSAADEAVTGQLVIRSNVRDDEAYIDDEAVGPTGPEAHVLEPGRYRVRVEKKGREPWRGEVEVRAGDTTRVTAELGRDSTVSSSEALRDAIDNAPAGAVITLEAGRYKGPFTIETDVTLKGSGGRRDTVIESAGDSDTLVIGSGAPRLHNLTVRYAGESDSAVAIRGAASPRLDNVVLELGGDGLAALYIRGTSRPRVSRALLHASPAPAEAHGILIRDDAAPRISGITVQGFEKNAAIAVADRAAPIIEDSRLRDIESNGIYVLHQAKGEYRRNHMESIALAAISVVDTAEPVFADNRLQDLESHAIQIGDRAGGRFEGNRINRAGTPRKPCVSIGTDTRAEVIDNVVIDCRGPAFYSPGSTGSRLSGNRSN